MDHAIYISSYSTDSATFASCERESTNAIQVKWIPSYSTPFSWEDITPREKTTVSLPFLFSLFRLRRSSGALRAASIESHELFSGRGLMSLFGFRVLPTGMARKESSLFLSRPRFFIWCAAQERSYTGGALRKGRQSSAHGVLFEEFWVEALVASLRFTAIIHQNTRRVFGSFRTRAFALEAIRRESVNAVVRWHFETSIRRVNRFDSKLHTLWRYYLWKNRRGYIL